MEGEEVCGGMEAILIALRASEDTGLTMACKQETKRTMTNRFPAELRGCEKEYNY